MSRVSERLNSLISEGKRKEAEVYRNLISGLLSKLDAAVVLGTLAATGRARFSQPDVLDNNLILLDSEILKPHKNPNFDQIAAFFGISPAVASVHMRGGSDPRGSANASSGTARLRPGARAIAGQASISRPDRHARGRN